MTTSSGETKGSASVDGQLGRKAGARRSALRPSNGFFCRDFSRFCDCASKCERCPHIVLPSREVNEPIHSPKLDPQMLKPAAPFRFELQDQPVELSVLSV